MDRIRGHVFIYGDVIGVGFRYWTVGVARKLQLTGWVKNLPDCVEAVFEGEKSKVLKMIEHCHEGPLTSRVERVHKEYLSPTNEFSNFSMIRQSSTMK